MAITTPVVVRIIPFPSILQRTSLEPDGIAVARLLITGDASGGEVQFEVRGPSSHLYKLRNHSIEMLVGPGDPAALIEFKRTWVEELTDITDFDAFNFVSIGAFISNTDYNNVMDRNDPYDRQFLLGSINRLSTAANPLILYRVATNTLNATYDLKVEFTAWRRESIQQPGFIDVLDGRVSQLRAGLVR